MSSPSSAPPHQLMTKLMERTSKEEMVNAILCNAMLGNELQKQSALQLCNAMRCHSIRCNDML